MVVYSMWRFKKDDRVVPQLIELLVDEDVSGHAASALRRSVGNELARPLLMAAREQVTSAASLAALSRHIKKAAAK